MENDLTDYGDYIDDIDAATKHLCWIYHDDTQRLAVAQPLLLSSLVRRLRCIVMTSKAMADQIRRELEEEDVNVARHLDTGQLTFIPPEEFLLTEGFFDLEAAMARLDNSLKQSIKDGWSGLMLISDASHLAGKINEDDWIKFELQMEYHCSTKPCIMLCMVDDRLATGSLVASLIKVHPVIGFGENLIKNPYFAGESNIQVYPS